MASKTQELLMKLLVTVVLVYLLKAFGVVNAILSLFGIPYSLPPLMSILSLFIIAFGTMLMAKFIMGPRPVGKNLIVDLVLAAALVGLWIFLPGMLPPELAVLAKTAQAVLRLG